MTEYRTISLETAHDFTKQYRRLEREISRWDAIMRAHVRGAAAEQAGEAASRHAELVDEQEDLMFHEMLRVWTNARQTNDMLPELPESWEEAGGGRALRCSYFEAEAYRGL
jgi:hypothetical protein